MRTITEAVRRGHSRGRYLDDKFFWPILLLQVGADRIMISADYPYGSMTQARTFLDQLPVSTTDKERIAHRNAERLLRL